MQNSILNPYFAVTVMESEIQTLRDKIMAMPLMQGREYSVLPEAHITVNYSIGGIDKTLVEETVNVLTQRPMQIKVTGASTILSKYYSKTIIVLTLDTSEDYLYTKNFLKSKLTTDRFTLRNQKANKVFDAHISLGLIPTLGNKENHQFQKELKNLDLAGPILNGQSLTIHNPYREKVLDKMFKQVV